MNVPGQFLGTSRTSAEQVFKLTQQVKSNGESEITTGTEPFLLVNAK